MLVGRHAAELSLLRDPSEIFFHGGNNADEMTTDDLFELVTKQRKRSNQSADN